MFNDIHNEKWSKHPGGGPSINSIGDVNFWPNKFICILPITAQAFSTSLAELSYVSTSCSEKLSP